MKRFTFIPKKDGFVAETTVGKSFEEKEIFAKILFDSVLNSDRLF